MDVSKENLTFAHGVSHLSLLTSFEVRPNTLYPKDFIIQRRVAGNVFFRGGGGYEMIHKGAIPINNIRRIK